MSTQNEMYDGSAGPDRQTLGSLIDQLRSGRGLILKIAGPIILLGLMYAAVAPSVYTAMGSVQVASWAKGATSAGAQSQLDVVLDQSPVLTAAEIGVIQSRMVLGAAATAVRLDIGSGPDYLSLVGRLLAPHADPNRLVVERLDVPPSFRDLPMKLVATKNGFDLYEPYQLLGGPYGAKILSGVVGTESTVRIGDSQVRILVKELTARPGSRFVVTAMWPLTVYGNMLLATKVTENPVGSGIISIQYSDRFPGLSAAVVNAIESAYLKQSIQRKSQTAASSLQFLDDQLPEIKRRVDEAEVRLNSYQIAQGSVDVQKETEIILNQVVSLEAERLSLEQQRERSASLYTSAQPYMQSIDQQIRTLDVNLSKLKRQLQQLPVKQQEILGLMRDLKVNTDLYTSLLNSAQQLKLSQAGTVDTARIVDRALPPVVASGPNRLLICIASILFGLIAAMGALFTRRMLVRGVESAQAIEGALGLPVLASIPRRQQKHRRRGKANAAALLAITDPADPVAEAFRLLRASFSLMAKEARNNVVLLTSPELDEGVAFITANLAAVLAAAGNKVVVVDADLRHPQLHEYFQAKSTPGVTEMMSGAGEWYSIMQTTQLPGLTLVAAGGQAQNPGDLLVSERFSSLISELSRRVDHVLIVSAPVLEIADAAVIGPLAGSTLVVLSTGRYPLVQIADTVRQLSRAGALLKGAVLTGVPENNRSRG